MASTVARFVVLVGVLGFAAISSAQDRLFVSGGVVLQPYTEEISAGAPFGTSLGPRSPLVHQPLIAGGRYVPNRLDSCDITPCVVVDWQGVAHPLPYAFASIVATDPVRPRVFVQTAAGAVDAVDVETGVVTPMFPAAASVSGSCRYAFSAARLFCLEATAAPSLRVFATGGAPGETPQVVSTVAGVAYGSPPWLVTPDGARLFSGENATTPARLTLTYVVTGARVTVDLPRSGNSPGTIPRAAACRAVRAHRTCLTKDLGYLGSASFPFASPPSPRGHRTALCPRAGRAIRGLRRRLHRRVRRRHLPSSRRSCTQDSAVRPASPCSALRGHRDVAAAVQGHDDAHVTNAVPPRPCCSMSAWCRDNRSHRDDHGSVG
jgi:hypothetical protein